MQCSLQRPRSVEKLLMAWQVKKRPAHSIEKGLQLPCVKWKDDLSYAYKHFVGVRRCGKLDPKLEQ